MGKISKWDQIDAYMQRGYTFFMKNYPHSARDACNDWKKAWELIVSAMDSGNYASIEDFDEDFGGLQSVFNWSSDYEMELGNAIRDDVSFAQTRIDFCKEYLNRISDKDGLNSLNMRRAIAETYFDMGMNDKGEQEFKKLTDEYPTWAWGWIGWSDQYGSFSKVKDHDKAIKLLTHALEIDGIEDVDVIKERLRDVYQDCGMNEEADSIVFSGEDYDRVPGISLSDIKVPTNIVNSTSNRLTGEIPKIPERKEKVKAVPIPKKVKIPRNAPCPCGSGKKYKQCCGKTQMSV